MKKALLGFTAKTGALIFDLVWVDTQGLSERRNLYKELDDVAMWHWPLWRTALFGRASMGCSPATHPTYLCP